MDVKNPILRLICGEAQPQENCAPSLMDLGVSVNTTKKKEVIKQFLLKFVGTWRLQGILFSIALASSTLESHYIVVYLHNY
jgi:hypothetical protein